MNWYLKSNLLCTQLVNAECRSGWSTLILFSPPRSFSSPDIFTYPSNLAKFVLWPKLNMYITLSILRIWNVFILLLNFRLQRNCSFSGSSWKQLAQEEGIGVTVLSNSTRATSRTLEKITLKLQFYWSHTKSEIGPLIFQLDLHCIFLNFLNFIYFIFSWEIFRTDRETEHTHTYTQPRSRSSALLDCKKG